MTKKLNEYVKEYINKLKAENKAWGNLQAAMFADLDKRLTKAYAERAVSSDGEFQNFVNKARVQREKNIARDAEDFRKKIEESYREVEKIKIDVIKELELRRLNSELKNFYEVQEEFNKKFVENMKFRLGDTGLNL